MNGWFFASWMIAAVMIGLTLILGPILGLTECESKEEVGRWARWMAIAILVEATYPISFPLLFVSGLRRWYKNLPKHIDPQEKKYYPSRMSF